MFQTIFLVVNCSWLSSGRLVRMGISDGARLQESLANAR